MQRQAVARAADFARAAAAESPSEPQDSMLSVSGSEDGNVRLRELFAAGLSDVEALPASLALSIGCPLRSACSGHGAPPFVGSACRCPM